MRLFLFRFYTCLEFFGFFVCNFFIFHFFGFLNSPIMKHFWSRGKTDKDVLLIFLLYWSPEYSCQCRKDSKFDFLIITNEVISATITLLLPILIGQIWLKRNDFLKFLLNDRYVKRLVTYTLYEHNLTIRNSTRFFIAKLESVMYYTDSFSF